MFGENSIKSSIHKHKKEKEFMFGCGSRESMEILRQNITQYMHPDMLYKIKFKI